MIDTAGWRLFFNGIGLVVNDTLMKEIKNNFVRCFKEIYLANQLV